MNIGKLFRVTAAAGLAAIQMGAMQPGPQAAIAAAPAPLGSGVGGPTCVGFDLQSAIHHVGHTFVDGGQTFQAVPHIWADSTVFAGGTLGIVGTTLAGGAANEIKLNNIGISTTFASGMYSVSFKFGEYGGNINLRVNGALANFADFNDIDGTMIGGALASVVNGFGNDMGSVTLNGSVTQLSVSGQELWIDDLCFETQPDPSTQPVPTKSDLGDAPDSRNHFSPTVYANTAYNFPATVLGAFPTTFDPPTAPPVQGQGPKHLSIAHAWLGPNVTAESEADLGPDADGANNILNGGADVSNMDKGDDGWLNPNAVFADCQTTDLVVRVSRSLLPLPATLNDLKLNVWFDGNRNGNWKDWIDCPGNQGTPGGLATEWIVRDYSVPIGSVPMGGYVIVTVTTNLIPNSALSLTHWIRFSLSEGPAASSSTGQGGGPSGNDPDGRGPSNGWRLGETEDYLIEGHPQPEPRWPDVGDAPDSTNHWGTTNTAYPGPVAANFPTVWDTTTAGGGPSGPKHANQIKLEGILGLAITKEDEADQGPDGDIINNIKNGGTDSANRDVADDGWLNPNVVIQNCFATVLKVRVSRGASATQPTMYLNTWFDGNRDGDWEDLAECPQSAAQPPGPRAEWIVRNFVVNMAAIPLGGFQDISVLTGRILNTAPLQDHWVRFTLSEQPVGSANGTFNLSLTPARADGRGIPFGNGAYRFGETEDYVYKPQLQEQPGTLAITKGLINTYGANTANKVITYVIELEHIGGTIWASTTMTDPLPAQVVPVGLPVVTQLNPAVAPLVASLISNTVVWNGGLMPGGKVRIEQAVRVKPCYGPTRVVHNTAYALQTATAGGGVISASADFDEFCKTIHVWATNSVTYTLKLHEDKGWDGTVKGLTAPQSLFSAEPTGPCKPPYMCAEITFSNNSNEPTAARVYLVKTPRTVVQVNPLAPEGAPGAVTEFSRCPSGKDVVMLPAHSTVTRFSRIRAPGPDMEPDLDLTVGDLDGDGLDAAVLFRASFFDVFTELNAAGSDDDDDPASRAARCIAEIVPVNIVRTDLGDAPDSSNHFPAAMTAYPGVPARFPSVFDPGTGLAQGPKHVRPENFHLGPRVSRERDADLLPDNDIMPNLRPPANVNDRDRWDDGLMLSAVKFQDCQMTNLPIQVFIDPLAKAWMTSTAKLGYINVWVDGNHDGDWEDARTCQNTTGGVDAAPEHIVINQPVNPATLALGVNTINVPTSRVPFTTTEAWLRVTLTTKPISLPLTTSVGPLINYSDGQGELYRLGETEDYLYRQPGAGQTAGSDVWIEKHGAPIGPRAAGLCVGNEQCDDNNTDALEWSLVFGNRGRDPAADVVVYDFLSGSNSSGWRVAKIITSTNFDVFNATVEVMPGGAAASDLVHVHLNGLPPGNPMRMIIVITRTKPVDIPMYPDPEFARGAPLTNTATITASNDTNMGNNSASATVVVAGPLLPPVLHGPGDGTVCAGVFTVTGWAIPGGLVQLYADGVPSGAFTATAGGLWWIPVAGLANGPHVLSATSTISAMVSPASNLMNITVDSSLTWSPLSMRFIDAMGGWHRPQDANGRTDVGGWLLALKANAVYTIEVRSCCVGDPNAGISVSFGPTDTVVLTDPDGDGLFIGVYTTGARTPPSSMTISALCFGIIKTSDGQVLIDPYGNVTDAINNQLLSGALVTNYEKQSSLYAVWDAAAFSQINPQTTAADGYYSFFTPPGTYQIGVTRSGYQNHRSADIVVTNALVRYDVALYPVVSGLRTVTVLLTEDGPDPAVIKVTPGTVVQFTSMTCCKATYDVKANKKLLARPQAVTDPVFDSGALLSGESFRVKYDDLGEYVYQAGDTIGTVVVENLSLVFLPMIRK